MPPSPENDIHLLKECLDGNSKASELFVRRFSDKVYRTIQYTLIRKYIRFSTYDLDDLHNTVFMNLFENQCKKLRQYEGRNGCSISTWIRTVAIRITLNEIRKKGIDGMREKVKAMSLDDLPEIRESETSACEQLEKHEQERILLDGIETLPPRDRLLVKLHFDQDLPLPEVAEIMNISIQNAYTIKHRAIQKLKSWFQVQEKNHSGVKEC